MTACFDIGLSASGTIPCPSWQIGEQTRQPPMTYGGDGGSPSEEVRAIVSQKLKGKKKSPMKESTKLLLRQANLGRPSKKKGRSFPNQTPHGPFSPERLAAWRSICSTEEYRKLSSIRSRKIIENRRNAGEDLRFQWITNETEVRKIAKNAPIPIGWRKGVTWTRSKRRKSS